MANTPIGVSLVAEGTSSFLGSLAQAQGGLSTFAGAIQNLSGSMGSIATQSSNLGSAVSIALGNALYDVGKKILSVGGDALQTVAKFERSTQSITAMYAVELMRGTEREEQTKSITQLTGKEEKALRDKLLQLDLANQAVAKQSEAVKVMKEQTGENTIELRAEEAQLQININRMNDLSDAISELQGKAGKEVFGKKMVSAGDAIEDTKEAFRAAQGPANAIIDQMTKLALISPFKREDTISTLKMAKGFGMTLEESAKLTESLTMFATVTGRSGDHISRLAYAMGEMKSTGKVMMRQVRQMNLAGVSVADMGEAFGMTAGEMTEAIHHGKVSFDEFGTKMSEFINAKYGDAFKNIANSFVGLNNAVDDIKELGLAAIFEGPLKLYKPLLEAFVQPFTSGTLLESIRGFSLDVTKSFMPMFEGLAAALTSTFGRFEKFASLIGGKGTVAIDKQEAAIKEHKNTITGLESSMEKLGKSGISMSTDFAKLTSDSVLLGSQQTQLKKELEANAAEMGALGKSTNDLTKQNAGYEKEMNRLKKAGKENSTEYKALNALMGDNSKIIGENRTQAIELNKEKVKLSQTSTGLNNKTADLSRSMGAMTLAGTHQSSMYKDLVAQMAAEEKVHGKQSEAYKTMAADLKIIEDNTGKYRGEIEKLSTATGVAKVLDDQLKELADNNKTMPWADAFLKANEDIMPKGSSLYNIFDTIFKIIKKVFDLFKSGSKEGVQDAAGSAFSFLEEVLKKVERALKFVLDNFDLIIATLKNVAIALGTLFAIGKSYSIIIRIMSIAAAMLNPLNLLIAAVAIFSVAWNKNFGGIQQKIAPYTKNITDKLKEITDWFKGVKPVTEEAEKTFDKHRGRIQDIINKIVAVFVPLKDTFVNAFKGVFTDDNTGIGKARESVQEFLRQLGVVPGEATVIGQKLKESLTGWKDYFNFPELLAGFKTDSPAFQTLKTDMASLFKVAFNKEDGEAVVQSFADKVREGILTVFGDGEDKTGFAAALGDVVAKGIILFAGSIDTLKTKLIEVKDILIDVAAHIYKHRDAYFDLAVVLAKVLFVMYLLNTANKLFGLTTLIPLAAGGMTALFTYGTALVTWAAGLFGTLTGMGAATTAATGVFVEGAGTLAIGGQTALGGIGTMLMAFLTSLGPVGWAILGVIVLFLGLALFNVEDLAFKIMNVFGALFKEVMDIVTTFVAEFGAAFIRIYEGFIKPLWEGYIQPVLEDIAEAFGFVMDAIALVITIIGGLVETVVTLLAPIFETVFLVVLGYIIAKFGLLWYGISLVIRIILALIKMVVRAITNSAAFIIMIDNLQKAWAFLKEYIVGPVGNFFNFLNEKIYEAISWLGSWQDSINKVIDSLGDLFKAKTKSEILKDTPMMIQVRDPGSKSFKMVANPEYIALEKIVEAEAAEVANQFKRTAEHITGENRYTALFQASKVVKPVEGSATDILGSLMGGSDASLAGLLGGLGLGKREPGDEEYEGPAPAAPPGTGGPRTGGGAAAPSVFMTIEQQEKAANNRVFAEQNRIYAAEQLQLKNQEYYAAQRFAKAAQANATTININGAYLSTYTAAAYAAKGGASKASTDTMISQAAKRRDALLGGTGGRGVSRINN